MKRFVCIVCVCWLFVSTFAQTPSLCITTDKTTSLIFPFSIRHVDRGTKDLLVQTVKEADNILLVKAAAKDFIETNLSVIIGDGTLYSFVVCYDSKPSLLVYYLPINQKATISTYANGIIDNGKTMRGLHDDSWGMQAEIIGIYIKENIIYYQLRLDNSSSINYDIELFRFFIRDKKKGKRTATQEMEVVPLYVAGNSSEVKANSQNIIVMALEKFTIPDAKYLAVQVMEKNGGRHLFLKVNNRKLIKAIPLPDLK